MSTFNLGEQVWKAHSYLTFCSNERESISRFEHLHRIQRDEAEQAPTNAKKHFLRNPSEDTFPLFSKKILIQHHVSLVRSSNVGIHQKEAARPNETEGSLQRVCPKE